MKHLPNDTKLRPYINGITISPKKNFCIIKIWLATCDVQDPSKIDDIGNVLLLMDVYLKNICQNIKIIYMLPRN